MIIFHKKSQCALNLMSAMKIYDHIMAGTTGKSKRERGRMWKWEKDSDIYCKGAQVICLSSTRDRNKFHFTSGKFEMIGCTLHICISIEFLFTYAYIYVWHRCIYGLVILSISISQTKCSALQCNAMQPKCIPASPFCCSSHYSNYRRNYYDYYYYW